MMSAAPAPTLTLNASQTAALEAIKAFLKSETNIFILNGSAGTGKTTLVKSICDFLHESKKPFALTATTGRAAKVLSTKAGHKATTLHSLLYQFDEISGNAKAGEDPWKSETGQLYLAFELRTPRENDPRPKVILVDEASMISHLTAESNHTAPFGSGNLLEDLLQFAATSKIIFVGDSCQLPPVADTVISAALHAPYWKDAGKSVDVCTLTEIVRQEANNEILAVASRFRKAIEAKTPGGELWKLPLPQGRNFFSTLGSTSFFQQFYEAVQTHGMEQTIAICHSNGEAPRLNRMMRQKLHGKPDLQVGDLLIVTQNSYSTDLVNGDQVVVEEIGAEEHRAGFRFLKVKIKSLFSAETYETMLVADLLTTHQATLSPDEVKRLLIDFDQRMRNREISRNSEVYKDAMRTDPYVNALRAKYGYALTVHKAQGGEWESVFLYLSNSIYAMVLDNRFPDKRHPDGPEQYHRWFYTAVTRARKALTVNDSPYVQSFAQREPEANKQYWKENQRYKSIKALDGKSPFPTGTLRGRVKTILNQNEKGMNGFLEVEGIAEKLYFILDPKSPVFPHIRVGQALTFEALPPRGDKGPKATKIRVLR